MGYKFTVVGDLHIASRQIGARKDDYLTSVAEKLTQVLQISVKNKVDGIILTGDIFHDKDESRISTEATILFSKFVRVAESRSIHIYSVVGNHDIKYHDLNISNRLLGLLSSTHKNFTLVSRDKVELSKEFKLTITGTDYTFHGDEGPIESRVQYFPEKQDTDFHIHVTHGSQLSEMDSSLPDFVDITRSEDILRNNPSWDININGHIHNPSTKFISLSSKWILNPGSLTRVSGSKSEITRDIEVAILTIPAPHSCQAELIKLNIKPAEQVFDVNSKIDDMQDLDSINEFLDSLSVTSSAKSSNGEIKIMIQKSVAEEEVKARAIEYVDKLDL